MNTNDVSLLLAAIGALAAGLILALIRLSKQERRIELLGNLALSTLDVMTILVENHAKLAKQLRLTVEQLEQFANSSDQSSVKTDAPTA